MIKHVVNDNGGTAVAGDFTMTVTGNSPSPATFPGDEAGTSVTINAGSYSVSETGGPTGYTETDSADCSGTGLPTAADYHLHDHQRRPGRQPDRHQARRQRQRRHRRRG